MAFMDSLDKIVFTYFATFTKVPFTYGRGGGDRKVQTVEPSLLTVSPNIFRHTTCPPSCGACCHAYGLTWLPSEVRAVEEEEWADKNGLERPSYVDDSYLRKVSFDGRVVDIYSDLNTDMRFARGTKVRKGIELLDSDSPGVACKHLSLADGRCQIHTRHPMSCDFELLRVLQFKDHNVLLQKLYGRGWAMTRIDGEKGAMCEVIEQSPEQKADLVRRLNRLKDWTDHFGLTTTLPEVINYCETGPHREGLTIPAGGFTFFGEVV